MNEVYMRIEQLCENKRVDITTMCKEAGVSRSILSEFKMGRTQKLSTATLAKLSDYFEVSVDYLLTGATQKEARALNPKDTRDIAKALEHIRVSLESEEGLMFDGDPISDEARESILAAMKLGLEAAKLKNKETYTPKKYKKG